MYACIPIKHILLLTILLTLLLLLFYHFEYRDNNIDDKMHVINIFLVT
jgi:hypothetical protein